MHMALAQAEYLWRDGAPAQKEKTMQCLYRCTRCDMGWLATIVEPSDCGWAVRVFVCGHCRYAAQPGVPVAVQAGEGALPVRVRAATVPVARLTGPGVEALRLEELLMLLGLRPAALGSVAQRPALARASRTAGGSPVTPEDEGEEDRQGGKAWGKAAEAFDQQPHRRECRGRHSQMRHSRSGPLTLLLQPAGTTGSRARKKREGGTGGAVSTAQASRGKSSVAGQLSPLPRRWGALTKWRLQDAEKHGTPAPRVAQEHTMTTPRQVIVPIRAWHIICVLLTHGRETLRTWQQRGAARHHLRGLLRLDDRLLADIGLNRLAIAGEARRPFWKPVAPDLVHGRGQHAEHRPCDPWPTLHFLPGLGALWPMSIMGFP